MPQGVYIFAAYGNGITRMAQKNASQSDVERGKTTKNSTNPVYDQ